MARTLKLAVRKDKIVRGLLPSEKKKVAQEIRLFAPYPFFFGFLEKHQKRPTEMRQTLASVLMVSIVSTWALTLSSVSHRVMP